MKSLAYQLTTTNNIEVPFNDHKKMAGKDWLACLMRRHPKLSLRQPKPRNLKQSYRFQSGASQSLFRFAWASIM